MPNDTPSTDRRTDTDKQIVSAQVPVDLLEELDDHTQERGRSEAIRRGIELVIAEREAEQRPERPPEVRA